jgi:hypothetical protein
MRSLGAEAPPPRPDLGQVLRRLGVAVCVALLAIAGYTMASSSLQISAVTGTGLTQTPTSHPLTLQNPGIARATVEGLAPRSANLDLVPSGPERSAPFTLGPGEMSMVWLVGRPLPCPATYETSAVQIRFSVLGVARISLVPLPSPIGGSC